MKKLFLPFLLVLALISSCHEPTKPTSEKRGFYLTVADTSGKPVKDAVVRVFYVMEPAEKQKPEINVFPNPFNSAFMISFAVDNDSSYFDAGLKYMNGIDLKSLFHDTLAKGTHNVVFYPENMKDLKPDFYVLWTKTGSIYKEVLIYYHDPTREIGLRGQYSHSFIKSFLTDADGKAFVPYDLFPYIKSSRVLTITDSKGEQLGTYKFTNQVCFLITSEKYKDKFDYESLTDTNVAKDVNIAVKNKY